MDFILDLILCILGVLATFIIFVLCLTVDLVLDFLIVMINFGFHTKIKRKKTFAEMFCEAGNKETKSKTKVKKESNTKNIKSTKKSPAWWDSSYDLEAKYYGLSDKEIQYCKDNIITPTEFVEEDDSVINE